jgi:hypothetical protein
MMATLVLGAFGTLVGGPLGGALGALVGRQIDGAIIGAPGREGPRLKELAISTSSYGQPIARQYGRMRVAGSVVWATELAERREKSGGGKGRPSVTSYSYSTSFAVALSSRPILGIGRVWADGSLLRGAAGDLKVGGTMRVHLGHGDQAPDQLIAAAQGAACPAFRQCAYVVFEDLQLADFGNRIPALSFEVFADQHEVGLGEVLAPLDISAATEMRLTGLAGFEHAGGDLRSVLATLDQLYPLVCGTAVGRLDFAAAEPSAGPVAVLPEPVAEPSEDDLAARSGRELHRGNAAEAIPAAVRYYDVARDYQPGIQRVEGRGAEGSERGIEFPGALNAATARSRTQAAARRASASRERLRWRIAALDPALMPGAQVRVPGRTGHWRVTGWEWRERGVELELERQPALARSQAPSDAGWLPPPLDQPLAPTWLHAFELPWDGIGAPTQRRLFAAASAVGPGWTGAALYAEHGGTLEPIGTSGRIRSVVGTTRSALPPSPAVRLEPSAVLEIELLADDMVLDTASPEEMAGGANRMLVGEEVLQFAGAEPIGGRGWRLTGLLRGRGGTEAAALRGVAAGNPVALLDDRLVAVGDVPGEAARLAAIGLADSEPVYAAIANSGLSLRPLAPVHCGMDTRADGGLDLRWTRRARGAWRWTGGIEVPLVEETERYRIGAGPVDQPMLAWETAQPHLTLAPADLSMLPTGTPLWVRQIGSHALSEAAFLCAAS